MTTLSRIIVLSVAAAAAGAGCKPMNPRPAAAPPAPPPEQRATGSTGNAVTDAPPGGSSSALGKARDAALRTKSAYEKYQEDVAKQADDVFRNP